MQVKEALDNKGNILDIKVNSIVWACVKLVDKNPRKAKVIYNGCEIRPCFVLSMKGENLTVLDVTGVNYSTYPYAVKIDYNSYVICDRMYEVKTTYLWPLTDKKDRKNFKRDSKGKLIITRHNVKLIKKFNLDSYIIQLIRSKIKQAREDKNRKINS